jgi:hypothetical protein
VWGWLDRHVRHIAVAVACVACTLVGMALGLAAGGHNVLPVFLHDAPRTVTRTTPGPVRTVTKPGKARRVEAAPQTVTVPTTITTTATVATSTSATTATTADSS